MEATEFTKFTAEVSDGEKITFEIPTQNATVRDICQAFRTIMAGMNFTDKATGEMIASYLEDWYGDMYNIVTINE